MPGAFVVLEGVEGAGKSTQARLLGERFERAGVRHVLVREPGGTPLGDAIRKVLLDPSSELAPATEALLFMASRAQLVQEVIRPALADGSHVIADRFFLSTYAYQIVGRGLPEADVRRANVLAIGGLVPDLTLLLDLAQREGLHRAAARGGHDRMERSGDEFHTRVASAFAEFATADWQSRHTECGPIVRIDAAGSEGSVSARIDEALFARLPRTVAGLAGSKS